MGTRGRKSIAEQSVNGRGLVTPRPDPPHDLGAAESIEWCAIVASMPANYFAGSHYPMLAQLCRVTVASRHTHQLIAACRKQKKPNINEYLKLLNMQLKESGMIMRLMRSMRLTHQSTLRAESVKTRPNRTLFDGRLEMPWDRKQ
jgi:hypothetical protein